MSFPVVQVLDAIAEATRAERSDGQLLDLFVRLRDQEAFAAVVRRHGPMVLGVCRRVLSNPADADDAFQAAFLVLAHKAASIGTRELLAPWLYGAAYNTARKLRRANARRAARERPLAEVPEPTTPAQHARDELLAALDEELRRLPERYRAPVVLCDLEGVTRKEAARLLGCPEGTVAGRLARARALLAARLAARGVTPAAGVLAVVLTERAALAAAAVADVVRAVGVSSLACAAARGLVSRRVADTTEGVLKAMFLKNLRVVAVGVLCCGFALAAIGLFHSANAQPAPEKPNVPFAAEEKGKPPAKQGKKLLTVIHLKKLDSAETVRILTDLYRGTGMTVAPAVGEKAVLLYADEQTTAEIEALLKKLGDGAPRMASVIRLKEGTNAAALGDQLARRYPWVTIVPVPDDNVLLVYADPVVTRHLKLHDIDAKEPATPAPRPEPKAYTVQFTKAKWDDVLDWYAKESGLTLVANTLPTGTLTLKPGEGKQFTLAEITDLLNEALLAQKWLLIRREKTFTVVPADEKVDPSLVPRIKLEELDRRGKTELVEVVIPMTMFGPDLKPVVPATDALPTVRRMLGPFGHVAARYYTGSRDDELLVRDVAGNLARIVETIRDWEQEAAKKKP